MLHHAGLFGVSTEVSLQAALLHTGKEAQKVKRAAQDKYSASESSSWSEATSAFVNRARLLLQYTPAIESPGTDLPRLEVSDAVFEWEMDSTNRRRQQRNSRNTGRAKQEGR